LTAALYIHIPFCEKKCDYCDFYSVPFDDETDSGILNRFLVNLCRDISGQIESFGVTNISSIYMGGGTPSILGHERMERLLDFLRPVSEECAEFTVEANPESLDEDFLNACAEGGVTRISCGIQTFDPEVRRALGRGGKISTLHSALSMLGEIYPDAFSADLISALPGQDEAAALRDIETLLRYKPAHVSLYDLMLEENTPLYKNVMSGSVTLPSLEKAVKVWIAGRDFLQDRGYLQYEVSNFARDGYLSIHNLVYWRMGNWLGAGPSASGTVIHRRRGGVYGERRTVSADAGSYAFDSAPVFVEKLDREALIKETFLMGFRCAGGPDEDLFKKRFKRPIESFAPVTFSAWRERGLLREETLALNGKGLLLLNRFLADCFLEMENTFDHDKNGE
jgi:oxygen-independent coproporphyrinogen-3 oxidase